MTITFKIDARKNSYSKKNEGFPITINIRNGQRKVIKTGYYTTVKNWDKANSLPKKSHPNYIEIINYLSKKKIIAGQLMDEAKYYDISVNEVAKKITNIDSDIFFEQATKYTKDKNDPKYCALVAFNKLYPNYTFTQINSEVAHDFMDDLRHTPTNSGLRSVNGVNAYMSKLTTLWNKCGKERNPFKGARLKSVDTPQRHLSDADIIKIRDAKFVKSRYNATISDDAPELHRYYWLLMFYLGGINLNVLTSLRHDKNIKNGRVEFNRDKGGSTVFCSNKLVPEAIEILNKIQDISNCYPYFTPMHKLQYKSARSNHNRAMKLYTRDMELSEKPTTYTARYSFINRAKQLVIDERICMEIVGHKQKSTNAIYADSFAYHIRDEAHDKIIRL